MIFEYAELGNLKNILADRKELVETYAEYWIYRIIEGVEYMHDRDIVHGDLKIENIYVTSDKKIKIGDFGFSQYENSSFFETLPEYIFPGTYGITQKETGRIPDKINDLYALGVIIYQLFALQPDIFDFNFDLLRNNKMKQIVKSLLNKEIKNIKILKSIIPYKLFV